MLLRKFVFLVAALLCAAFNNVQAGPQDWIKVNEFLEGVSILQNGVSSFTKVKDLPEEIRKIVLINFLGAQLTIDDVVDGESELALKDAACDRFALKAGDSDILMDPGTPGASPYDFRLVARKVSLRCTKGTVVFKNLKFIGAGSIIGSVDDGEVDFTVSESDPNTGFTLDTKFVVNSIAEGGVPQPLPEKVTIPECAVNIPRNFIVVDIAKVLGITNGTLKEWVNNAAALIVNAIVGLLACDVIEQFAELKGGDPGYISRVVADLSDFLRDLTKTEKKDLIEVDKLAGREVVDVWGLDKSEVTVYDDTNTLLGLSQAFVNGILGSKNNDTGDLTINAFANQLTDDTGEFRAAFGSSFNFDSGYTESANLKNAYLSAGGLNSFNNLNLIAKPEFEDYVAQYTLKNELFLDKFSVGAGGLFTAVKSNVPPSQLEDNTFYIFATKPLVLDLQMVTKILAPHVILHTVVGLTPAQLNVVGIGELISEAAYETQTTFACAAQAFAFFNVSDIEIPGIGVDEISITGVVDKGVDDLLTSGTEVFGQLYLTFLNSNMDKIMRGYLDPFNAFARDFIAESKDNLDACPEFVQPDLADYKPNYLEFNSAQVKTVRNLLAQTIEQVNDPGVGINSILRQLSGNAQHEVVIGDLFSVALPPVDGKTAELGIKKLKLVNPDSFSKISLMKPVGVPEDAYDPQAPEYYTENAFNLGYTAGADGGPIIVELTVELNTGGIAGLPEEKEVFPLRLALSEMDILVTVMAKADLTNLYPYTVGTVLQYPYCLLNTVVTRLEDDAPGFRIEELEVKIGQIDFIVECGNCPLEEQLKTDAAKKAVTDEFNLIVALLTNEIKTPVATEEMNKLFKSLGESCQEGYGFTLPVRPDFPTLALPITLGVNGAVFGAIGAGVLFLAMTSRRRIQKSSSAALGGGDLLNKVNSGQFSNPSELAAMFNFRKSLFFDSRVPTWLKLMVLLIAIAAIGLFAISNSVLNNQVYTKIVLQDSVEAQLPSIYDLYLLDEVNGLFLAGAPEVAMGSVFTSMVFSFASVVISAYCFIAPPSHLSVARRGAVLNFLVIASKFIFGEKYIVLAMTRLFNLRVKMPVDGGRESLQDIFPEGFLDVIIKFLPQGGYFAFYVGGIFGVVVLLVVITLHRNIIEKDWEQDKDQMEDAAPKEMLPKVYSPSDRENLFTHIFTIPGTLKGRAKVSPFGKLVLIVMPLAAFGIVYGTFFVSSYYFQILGVAGAALRLTEDGSSRIELSFADLAFGLSDVANGVEDAGIAFGLLFLQIVVVCSLVLAPLVLMVTTATMVMVKLTAAQRRLCVTISTAMWTTCSYEAIVLLVGFTTIYIKDLSSIATFAICYELDVYLSTYFTGFGLPPDEATCAGVKGGVLAPYWIALIGAFLMYAGNSITSSLSKLALDDVNGRSSFDDRMNRMEKVRKKFFFYKKLGLLTLAGEDELAHSTGGSGRASGYSDYVGPYGSNNGPFINGPHESSNRSVTSQYDLDRLRQGLQDRQSGNPRYQEDDDQASLGTYASASRYRPGSTPDI